MLGIWIDPDRRLPAVEKPVIVVAEVVGGRKKQVMVAWRKSRWRIRNEEEKQRKRKAEFGFQSPVMEWEGMRSPKTGSSYDTTAPVDVRKVFMWQPLPKMPNPC